MNASHDFSLDHGFPPESPFFDGHFPGNPIVPGAIILAVLASRLAARGIAIARVERMKFIRPLRPGVPFDAVLSDRRGGTRAEFRDCDGVFATASVALRQCLD